MYKRPQGVPRVVTHAILFVREVASQLSGAPGENEGT
jgi:hypothetical protein